jgi:hypothetical protein
MADAERLPGCWPCITLFNEGNQNGTSFVPKDCLGTRRRRGHFFSPGERC